MLPQVLELWSFCVLVVRSVFICLEFRSKNSVPHYLWQTYGLTWLKFRWGQLCSTLPGLLEYPPCPVPTWWVSQASTSDRSFSCGLDQPRQQQWLNLDQCDQDISRRCYSNYSNLVVMFPTFCDALWFLWNAHKKWTYLLPGIQTVWAKTAPGLDWQQFKALDAIGAKVDAILYLDLWLEVDAILYLLFLRPKV